MEHVAFLLEDSGERLDCLLNPESVVLQRRAGIRTRESAGGLVAGSELSDNPVLCTGGGDTELTLDLLFDVSLAGSSIATEDVRDLTRPFWNLSENTRRREGYGRPPLVRFVWGKSWNLPTVVTAVAERLEYFTPGGIPGRSWLRMRLLRVQEPSGADAARDQVPAPPLPEYGSEDLLRLSERSEVLEMAGGSPSGAELDTVMLSEQRLDQLAFWAYGDPSWWRWLAWLNGVADPLRIEAGQLLRIAPRSELGVPT